MSTSQPPAPDRTASPPGENRHRALQAELTELADVVGPAALVDVLLERAFQMHATDIHLDPDADGLRVRLRVDGLLHQVLRLPDTVQNQVISRIKLLANMNIAERRQSQDGHFANSALGGERDVRVGSSPTIYGERLVLRLMPDSSSYNDLTQLGFMPDQLDLLQKQLSSPYGMIVVAGPVGSGKSTTLYACLERLNDPTRSLTTIEDPVERRIEGINQIQLEPKQGFSFPEALRGILRQDPNVLMVGEIRDPETAHIACRAGLSGVMLLTSIHAHDAVAAIDVLRELGIPPMFIADAVHCIVSQRLIRKVCPLSREDYHPDEAACAAIGIPPEHAGEVTLSRGVPDPVNFNTGYSGRTGLFEILPIGGELRKAILRSASHEELTEIARRHGMKSLGVAAREKVLDGTTSVEEMHRVVVAG